MPHLPNLVAAGAVGALAWHFLRRAGTLAADERDRMGTGPGVERFRRWSYRVGGLFLGAVALLLLLGAWS
ncbi:MAG TPA: hypothetical protein VFJ85_15250 [Acidimicrobiales bacterium]|nr:hypothetical protein [Acidimicrobiales bacterium]